MKTIAMVCAGARRAVLWAAVTSALAATLVACGGGSNEQTTGNPPPVVQPPAVAPTISAAPLSVTVISGQPAAFAVVANGTAPIAYQWLRNGVAIAGATSANYTLVPTVADSGALISVRVSNSTGAVTSPEATLSVTAVASVAITAQPQSVTVDAGATATFTVVAQGVPASLTPQVQWLRNGAEIAGATSSSHTTSALTVADSGTRYTARVSGGAATPVLSNEAVLTVNPLAAARTPEVSAGLGFTLALRADGSVLLLGSNAALDRTPGAALAGTSARVIAGITAQSVAAGRNNALAVGSDGRLVGWGTATGGNLGGNLINANVDTPQQLGGVDGVTAGLPTNAYSLALRNDGSVWHWPGVLNFAPQTVAPRQIAGLAGVRKLVSGMTGGIDGKTSPLAIKTDGTVWALSWTAVTAGSTQTHTGSATQVAGLANVVDVSCTQHCLALLADGSVVAWGRNVEGQLGNGSSGDFTLVTIPVVVSGLTDVRAIGASVQGSIAVANDGRVWSWGGQFYNGQGATGTLTRPTLLAALAGVVDVSSDDRLVVLRLADGTLRTWGNNANGSLGDGTLQERLAPVQATGIRLN